MNKGFKKYFRESYKKSFKSLKKTSNYFKYLIFTIMNYMSVFLLPLKPVTSVASIRMAKNIKEGKDVCISNTMVVAEKPKSYWNYLLISGLKALIFGSIGLALLLVGGLLVLLGYTLTALVDADSFVLAIVLAVPAIVALIVFLFAMPYLSVSTAYLIDTYPNVSASKDLYSSFESLKRGGKKTLFVNDLVHALLMLVSILPLAIVLIVCIVLEAGLGITLLVVLLMLLGILYLYPRFILSNQLVKISILDDIVLDDTTLKQKFVGIDFDKFDPKASSLEKRLLNIFDSEKNLNLEAKLFKEIPSVKTEGDANLSKVSDTELPDIDFDAFKKENKTTKVVEPVEEVLVEEEKPVETHVEEKEVLVEEEKIAEEVKPIETLVKEDLSFEVSSNKESDDNEMDEIFMESDEIFLDSEGE